MVDIILRRQPRHSSSCGQHCVAMLTGGDVSRVVEIFGHDSATQWQEIVRALKVLGVTCMPFPAVIKKQPKPKQCIVRVNSKDYRSWSHFVVFSNGYWYDPAFGGASGRQRHPNWEGHMYQASYLEILGYAKNFRRPALPRPIQPAIKAATWDRMTKLSKAKIVENVFGIANCFTNLAPAWTLAKKIVAKGYSFGWVEHADGGFYCLLDGKEKRYVGHGKTYSESLCAAALRAKGLLTDK